MLMSEIKEEGSAQEVKGINVQSNGARRLGKASVRTFSGLFLKERDL